MKIGYARVSTEDQQLDLQLDALKKAGCDRIFCDRGVPGQAFSRSGLDAALRALRPGHTLTVWRLDRLGRSLVGLVKIIDMLGKRKIEFQSLTENIDTTSSGGRLVFHIMAALAEFERCLISERTRAGMEAARTRGKHIGRPRALTPVQVRSAILQCQHGEDISGVAKRLSVTRRTLLRSIARESGEDGRGTRH